MTTKTLMARLRADLATARRARDRERILVLSTTIAEVRNSEIDRGVTLGDDDVLGVIARGIKRRREAAELAHKAGREDLVAVEGSQAEVLGAYLPAALTEAEVREFVREAISTGTTHMGAVMGKVMPKIRGRFDGRDASRVVREELAAASRGDASER
ncbi:MAG: GatB/YqeY domain-containing protein [Gemmatimonadetes bacterium]|nr:GatB/YqeY domain-containing protein [Gemmatimonadota bacterium]